jgi:hypothetical protein
MTHRESQSAPFEQILSKLHIEQRDKLAELPIDLNRKGRDDLF